ncbi:hypothetical protein [Mariniplasma anaerobium]|uniref:Lipoprotein n=1 Tax=Mariniplasma anaerobium TaxID=2735436 RepID=A0A7U9TH32_9MOLU|nr:hypothetical protein [Mariniplasma anaerobium]BCR35657.1 hypothetical protein MPAN_005500 [Mariniplasma anaerobium]
MKKIFILCVLVLSVAIITGCAKEEDIFGSYDFENKTQDSLDDIKETISDYKTKMLDIADLQEREAITDQTTFTRDELPEIDENNINDNNARLIFYRTAMDLENIVFFLDSCESFEENSFCTLTGIYQNITIKVKKENDQLYIEEYINNNHLQGTQMIYQVRANIIYLNFIEDNIYIQKVRDINYSSLDDSTQSVSYESYYESGDYISLGVEKKGSNAYYYYVENAKKEVFHTFTNNDNQDIYISIYDPEKSFDSSIVLNGELDVIQSGINYKNPLSNFSYYSNPLINHPITLRWDLLEIQGWTTVEIDNIDQNKVFIDGVEVLQDYDKSFFVGDSYQIRYDFDEIEEPLTQSILDLSQEGLLFNAISLEKLNQDKMFLEDNYMSILENFNFSLDAQNNYTKINEMIPFSSDESIVNEMFETLIENE